MQSSHLILCRPLLLLPSIFPSGWDPDSLRPALRLGGQATAWEGSPGRSLCLTESSACWRLWLVKRKLKSQMDQVVVDEDLGVPNEFQADKEQLRRSVGTDQLAERCYSRG